MLRRDAKIALVVILMLMVLVVIIWGQGPRPTADQIDPYADRAPSPTPAAHAANVTATVPPGPAPAPARAPDPVTLDAARRDAPTHPPTDRDPSPAPAMIRHLPDMATMVHAGDPPPAHPSAVARLAAGQPAPGPLAPPAPRPTPLPAARPKYLATHIIAKDDNYTKLAQKYYNDGSKWRLIYEANKVSPQALSIGRSINIPHLAPPPAAAKAPAGTPSGIAARLAARSPGAALPAAAKITPTGKDGSRKYTVKKGESFYSIARKVYRDPGKWTRLYSHNKARLPRPSDPSSLRVGTVIALPDLASAR